MATLTFGPGAVAGCRMVATDLFTRVSIEAKNALYWPSLLKQSYGKFATNVSVVLEPGQNTGTCVDSYNQQQIKFRA